MGTAQEATQSTAQNAPGVLDPDQFQGDAREAYKIARQDPALLAQLHCYCGCDKEAGHRSLLDCFRSTHGSVCEVCIGEALHARQMANEGTPIEQIRDSLRMRYSHGG